MATTATKPGTVIPDLDAATERAREVNDRVAETGRKVTSVYLDGVEKYVSGLTQLTDEVTKASLSAARELIAS